MKPPSAAAVDHAFVDAAGVRFHVATRGEGDRLALLLHGFPECWYSWRHQIPLLASLGYRVWAPDLRGYGRSDRPVGIAAYSIEALMRDVAALIDASGAKTVTLIAHDWGGIVAWFFAMRRVRPLERLVVMNLPHPFAAEKAFRTWSQRRRSLYALFFQLPRLPEMLLRARDYRAVGEAFRSSCVHPERFTDEDLAVFRAEAARPGALTAMLDYYRAFVRGGGWRRQKALGPEVIETPTLLVWGEQDIALTKATTDGTEAFVSDLTTRFLPDASHWVQQDAPEEVGAILREWLEAPRPEAARHSNQNRRQA